MYVLKKKEELSNINFRRKAKGLPAIDEELPVKSFDDFGKEASTIFRKGDYCKWYITNKNPVYLLFSWIFT